MQVAFYFLLLKKKSEGRQLLALGLHLSKVLVNVSAELKL